MDLLGKKILIVGCGGGYDIFCGLPLYFKYETQQPILANYSFTNNQLLQLGVKVSPSDSLLREINYKKITLPSNEEYHKLLIGDQKVPDWLLKQLNITAEEYYQDQMNGTCRNGNYYFPEYELSQALDRPVYTFNGDHGGKGIVDSLSYLVSQHQIDVLILVDGGTDSLMTGQELQLGTPHEDMTTLAAANKVQSIYPNLQTYLYVLGYNIDFSHGITDESVNLNILQLVYDNGFCGCYHLLNDPSSAKKYIETFQKCSPENSWINALVTTSLQGQTRAPDYITEKRGKCQLPISPMMGLYWIFDLSVVVAQKRWDMIKLAETTDDLEVSELINL